jgi:hypothetical protein
MMTSMLILVRKMLAPLLILDSLTGLDSPGKELQVNQIFFIQGEAMALCHLIAQQTVLLHQKSVF